MLKGTPQQKQLAFNALGQLAANVVQPQIIPQGIDTSYSGVGLGNMAGEFVGELMDDPEIVAAIQDY